MPTKLQKLKGTKAYGILMLAAMVVFFYAVFKILTPDNFGSPANLYSYLQSSIIYRHPLINSSRKYRPS